MWFGLLGPLLVRDGDAVIAVPAARQRVLLAALLVHTGQAVPADTLAELVWDGAPPAGAAVTLRSHVMRLRRVLGPGPGDRVTTRYPGYLLQAGEREADHVRFTCLCREGGAAVQAADWPRAHRMLSEALDLWRGEPLADVPSRLLGRDEVPHWEHLRLQALEGRIDAGLQLGSHRELEPELHALAARHPLRERFHAQLMLALYRCGRPAEALVAYQQARRVLAEELGTDPGRGLRDLHQRILAADPALAAPEPARVQIPARVPVQVPSPRPPPAQTAGGSGWPAPRELPAPVPHFVGRIRELGALTALPSGREPPGTVVISAIGGMAGVGKTALAVHWAHQVSRRFPDGQLYVNLRGYDRARPMAATDALAGFLRVLGVPGPDMPAGQAERAARFRTLLAGRRMLIVLDNASDCEQVRPLLPGSPGCLVLITSRSELAGLVAAEGAYPLTLDVLSPAEASELLARRLGGQRLAAQPGVAAELIECCARLPLALVIAAARAALQPDLPLATVVAELRDATGRLDALDVGDQASSVRAVFSWSYRNLSHPTARMFRLLGVHPGPEISAPAAASLAGLSLPKARGLLAELTGIRLLTSHPPGRFSCHDLLRAYAAELARATDGDADCREAAGRLLDHYLHTAHAAALLINPAREPLRLDPPAAGVTPEALTGHEQAVAWLDAEYATLAAVIAQAARTGFDAPVWQLSWTLADYFDRRGDWLAWLATEQQALAAARRLGDRDGQARTSRSLGIVSGRLGRYRDARRHLNDALALFAALGDLVGQARAHTTLGWLSTCQGQHRTALAHVEQALPLFRTLGNAQGEAQALNGAGWCHAELGEDQQAITCCRAAVAIYAELGNRYGEGGAWDSLGYAHVRAGEHHTAVTCYHRALALHREIGDLRGQAEVLSHLGDTYLSAGQLRRARDAWRTAVSIFEELHHPEASQTQAKLDRLDAAVSG